MYKLAKTDNVPIVILSFHPLPYHQILNTNESALRSVKIKLTDKFETFYLSFK